MKFQNFPLKTIMIISILIGICFFVLYKFKDSILYYVDPYMINDCNLSLRVFNDTYINIRVKPQQDTYIDKFGFNGTSFNCYFDNSQNFKMGWNDYNISDMTREIKFGGVYLAKNCSKEFKIAIVVPYRNREIQFKLFTENIHKYLIRQNINYSLFIINQNDTYLFNKGALFNAAFITLNLLENYDCIVLHDIDSFPTNLLNRYDCPTPLRHLKLVDDNQKKHWAYTQYSGGVVSITPELFMKVNGYSNQYFGWGLEDDDFFERNEYHGYYMKRPSSCIGTYYSLDVNNNRQYTWSFRRFIIYWTRLIRKKYDGLNNVEFDVVFTDTQPLYTFIAIKIKPHRFHEMNYILCDIPTILLYLVSILLSKIFIKMNIVAS